MVTAIATSLRNSFRDDTNTALDGGSVVLRAGATVLATLSLGATPFTLTNGVLTLAANKTATASGGAGDTPTHADFRDASNAVQFTASCGLTGAPGVELEWSGTITAGQPVQLDAGTEIVMPS